MNSLNYRDRRRFVLRPVVYGMIFAALAFTRWACAQEVGSGPRPAAQVSPNAAALFERMNEQGSIDFDTAVGGYVVRIFNHVTKETTEAQLTDVRKALEEAKGYRIANERALGREVDEAALDAEISANIAEMSANLSESGLQTFARKYYYLQGESYRIEQLSLSNKVSLEHLRDDLENGTIQFKPTYIRTWNGKKYAEIVRPGSNSTLDHIDPSKQSRQSTLGAIATLSYENQGELPKFTAYARDTAADPALLKAMAKQGFPATTVAGETSEGDNTVILRVGSPESVSVYLEVTVLPAKGYCVLSAFTKVRSAVLSREDYRDFVQTSAGFWLPMNIRREAYKFDERQIPYLSSKEELLAFESPKTNVPLEQSLFDLSSSKEWKALPLSTHLLAQGSPLIEKPSIDEGVDSNRTIFIVVNVLLVVGLASFWLYRKFALK